MQSTPQQAKETAESEGELSQFAEEKAIQLALDSATAELENGQYFTSIVTHGWLPMPCGCGYSNGSRQAGSKEVKPPGLLNCGRIILSVWREPRRSSRAIHLSCNLHWDSDTQSPIFPPINVSFY